MAGNIAKLDLEKNNTIIRSVSSRHLGDRRQNAGTPAATRRGSEKDRQQGRERESARERARERGGGREGEREIRPPSHPPTKEKRQRPLNHGLDQN